jgi:hypothetical protein
MTPVMYIVYDKAVAGDLAKYVLAGEANDYSSIHGAARGVPRHR